jgi:hypothetical protein
MEEAKTIPLFATWYIIIHLCIPALLEKERNICKLQNENLVIYFVKSVGFCSCAKKTCDGGII